MKETIQRISVIVFFTLAAITLLIFLFGLFCILWSIEIVILSLLFKIGITVGMIMMLDGIVMIATV